MTQVPNGMKTRFSSKIAKAFTLVASAGRLTSEENGSSLFNP